MKFLDIITEETNRPLDHPFYRKILNIISKKLDIKKLGISLKDANRSAQLDSLLRNVWPLDSITEFERPIYLRHWLEDTFKLEKKDIANILYLVYRNTQVDDFLNDPLITNEPFWVTKIYYFEDEIEESTDEESWDCESCGGSGWEEDECVECGGGGAVEYDEGEGMEECCECGGSGEIEIDCSSCYGECQQYSETDVAILWRNQMVVTSEEKIPEPQEGSEFLVWYNKYRNKFDIISDENHDPQKVELKYEGEQTELERDRGTVDYVNQRKIDNEEEIKKFSKFWLV
jgi:hypothetical protein